MTGAALIRWACLGASLVFGVAAFVQACRFFVNRSRYRAAVKCWRLVQADILDAQVAVTSAGQTVTGFNRHPSVTYRYQVDKQVYTGHRVSLSRRPPFSTEAGAAAWLDQYAVGTTHDVWFDPKRPHVSALELNAPAAADSISTVFVLATLSAALALIA